MQTTRFFELELAYRRSRDQVVDVAKPRGIAVHSGASKSADTREASLLVGIWYPWNLSPSRATLTLIFYYNALRRGH